MQEEKKKTNAFMIQFKLQNNKTIKTNFHNFSQQRNKQTKKIKTRAKFYFQKKNKFNKLEVFLVISFLATI